MSQPKKSVLFVCLGNICRSPIAEAVFVKQLKAAGKYDDWIVDSAAIGSWHVGKNPDRRAISVLTKHQVPTNHKARQVKKADFSEFDYIFGMDDDNIDDLKSMAPASFKAKIEMLSRYDADIDADRTIRDPYYDSGEEGFEKCYQQCVRCCTTFLQRIG
ncbi:hypothetical protein DAPPUDRAFT_188255 [Daphnia pulex]|uniref:Low molecular weight phosphotyrosine protein phosphatase n=1 Tax=Daphnia pulex TaxID=6669 RepID=E9GL49_DAPPU|nr:hypothetical protein DAPPUDRAFT_188255 [Daphnia pulex]|eukprot:EFX79792.1 hypothetical protein DAPPUDRAFT_188255 [Daphnia pulex]